MTVVKDLIPDILEQEIDVVAEKVAILDGMVDLVHIDIMDGIMVDNLTIGLSQLSDIEFPADMKIDMHLMVEYPTEYLGECHTLRVYRALAQIERMNSQREFVETAEELGVKPCLALDLHTPAESIEKELYERLDAILVMSVKAGWSGQKFDASVIEKIKELRKLGYGGHIVMDGGMDGETICPCWQAGADQFAINSYFWKAEDKQATLEISC